MTYLTTFENQNILRESTFKDINHSKLSFVFPNSNKPEVFVYHLGNVSPEQEVTCIRMSVFLQFLIALLKPLRPEYHVSQYCSILPSFSLLYWFNLHS